MRMLIFKCYFLVISYLFNVKNPKKITIKGMPYLRIKGKLILGENIIINSGMRYNCIFNQGKTIIVGRDSSVIKIGNDVGISNTVIYAQNSISIGNKTLIGAGVKIFDTDFHSLDDSIRNSKYDIGKSAPVVIGERCFIGAGSIILKGVTLGDSVIIAAGSVVSVSIPSGQVWGGNPIKRIR